MIPFYHLIYIVLPRYSSISFSNVKTPGQYSALAGFNYWLHDLFSTCFHRMKIQLRLFKSRGKFLLGIPWWSFCIYRNSIFTVLSLIMRDKISSRFNELKFQPGLKISIWAAPKIETVEEIVIHFCKRLHLRCLNGYRMCYCCVSDNYLSVSFPTQPYLLLFCFQWWFKVSSFSNFSFFHKTHTLALQLATRWYWRVWWHLPVCPYITEGRLL